MSPQIFEKIWNSPNGVIRGWGKLIHEKNQKQKISWHCPLKYSKLSSQPCTAHPPPYYRGQRLEYRVWSASTIDWSCCHTAFAIKDPSQFTSNQVSILVYRAFSLSYTLNLWGGGEGDFFGHIIRPLPNNTLIKILSKRCNVLNLITFKIFKKQTRLCKYLVNLTQS
jgi:hypothetical protein